MNAIYVAKAGDELHVRARRMLLPGETITEIRGERRREPSRHSLQIGDGEHVVTPDGVANLVLLEEYSWRFLNHSCGANSRIVGMRLIAIREIATGEEVTFNYNTTEYDMASPFACRCGAAVCAGEIRGYRHLSEAQREKLRPILCGYLLAMNEA